MSPMAFMASPELRAAKLRSLSAAAASAVGNGCTVEEAREAFEAGVAAEVEMQDRRRAAQADQPLPGPASPATATPALDAWAAA
jgi:hypothetical protein